MHWGTFPLTDEPIEEPPERLRTACAARGVPPGEFIAVRPGSVVSSIDGPLPLPAAAEGMPVLAPVQAVVEGRTPAGEQIAASEASRPPASTLTLFERLRAYL